MRGSPKVELVVTTVAGAFAAGVALFAVTRTWVVEEGYRPVPFGPLGIDRSGASVAPAVPIVAAVALACVAAALATWGRGRYVVGAVTVLVGGVLMATILGLDARIDDDYAVWPLLCLIAGGIVAAAGMVTVWRGRSWPAIRKVGAKVHR